MKKESKKLMALFMSMTLGIASITTSAFANDTNVATDKSVCVQSVEVTNEAIVDADSNNESATNEAVVIEAIGLKTSYATGEIISVMPRVINTGSKDLKIRAWTTSFGEGGTISAKLTGADGSVVDDFSRWDGIVNSAVYSGFLSVNEYAERIFEYQTSEVTPGAYTFEVSFAYFDDNNAKQAVSKKYPLQIGMAGGTQYEDTVVIGGAAFRSDNEANIKGYTNELDGYEFKLPIAIYEYPGAKYYTTVTEDDFVYNSGSLENYVPVGVYTDENGKIWGYLKNFSFSHKAAWYCISDLDKKADKERVLVTDTIVSITEDSTSHVKTLHFADSVLTLNDDIKITRNGKEISSDDLKAGMVVSYDALYELETYPSIICGCTKIEVENSIIVYYGDFDFDGKVTLKDAKTALRLALGIDMTTDEQKLYGDIDGNGISLTDAKEYLRMSLGIIPARTKSLYINIPDETRDFASEDGKVEAVKVSDMDVFKYLSYDCEKEIPDAKQYNRDSFVHIIDSEYKNQFGTKITLMELFDVAEEDFDNYEYGVGHEG